MKQYPIVVKDKDRIPWELIRPDEKIAEFRKSKVWLISKVIKDMAISVSYLIVQDARDIVSNIEKDDARSIH
jgi:hypothetical protein